MPHKQKLLDRLAHQYPFRYIDKVVEVEPGARIVAIKNLSINEPFFQGHFPDHPITPGTIILESIVQAATVLMLGNDDLSGQVSKLESVSKFELKRDAVPGDQLRIEVDKISSNENTTSFNGLVLDDGKVVAEAKFSFAFSQIPSRPNIHPTASVHPTAVLGKDVIVGPYSIVGEEVFIGDRTTIEAHVMIDKWTQIGEDNHIHFGAVIGSPGQDTKYSGEKAYVSIGDRNELREYVTINRATGKDQVTRLGNDNMLMTNTHLGHNCNVGSNIIMANMVHVAGHVTIEDYAIIGGLTGVHQFVRIGKGCMIGGYSGLAQDVPPFMTCDGNPAYVRGINAIGIKRRGGDSSTVKELKEAYKLLYRSDVTHKEAIARIEKESNSDTLAHLVAFLKQDTSRGISKKREKVADEE